MRRNNGLRSLFGARPPARPNGAGGPGEPALAYQTKAIDTGPQKPWIASPIEIAGENIPAQSTIFELRI
jgi:hypothetical protein